jgi:hypothetical protein
VFEVVGIDPLESGYCRWHSLAPGV